MSKKTIDDIITDHAVLRFVERSWGVDIKQAKAILSQSKVLDSGVTLGNCTVPIDDMTRAVFKNGIMVTVVPINAKPRIH